MHKTIKRTVKKIDGALWRPFNGTGRGVVQSNSEKTI